VHRASERAAAPFVSINCAALPDTLLESELFGHTRGAFTGATQERRGLFGTAAGGTLFLDEIGEMAPGTQAKLLRVLQEREFRRVGGTRPIRVDVRVIASTNRDLEEAIAAGDFRQDLYFRIKVVEVVLPPLRERLEDIPELCAHFLGQVAGEMGRPTPEVSDETLALLRRHRWPGNIRELRNVLERAMVLGVGDRLEPKHLPRELRHKSGDTGAIGEDLSLAGMERRHVGEVLDLTGWNKSRAADLLSISRPRLDRKIRDYDLQPPAE
jgi:transcriptional regulator with PAS, ATPase and Fis domain